MKKNPYILRFGDWDPDTVIVADTLEQIAEAICEYCEDRLFFPDKIELVKQMKQREKEGCVYLFDKDDQVPEDYEIMVNRGFRMG